MYISTVNTEYSLRNIMSNIDYHLCSKKQMFKTLLTLSIVPILDKT